MSPPSPDPPRQGDRGVGWKLLETEGIKCQKLGALGDVKMIKQSLKSKGNARETASCLDCVGQQQERIGFAYSLNCLTFHANMPPQGN